MSRPTPAHRVRLWVEGSHQKLYEHVGTSRLLRWGRGSTCHCWGGSSAWTGVGWERERLQLSERPHQRKRSRWQLGMGRHDQCCGPSCWDRGGIACAASVVCGSLLASRSALQRESRPMLPRRIQKSILRKDSWAPVPRERSVARSVRGRWGRPYSFSCSTYGSDERWR